VLILSKQDDAFLAVGWQHDIQCHGLAVGHVFEPA
jgi:hypothetical protein